MFVFAKRIIEFSKELISLKSANLTNNTNIRRIIVMMLKLIGNRFAR
mgnify:CR=1 FL=1